MLGYSEAFFGAYSDITTVSGIDNGKWEYSDTCFIEVRNNLEKLAILRDTRANNITKQTVSKKSIRFFKL